MRLFSSPLNCIQAHLKKIGIIWNVSKNASLNHTQKKTGLLQSTRVTRLDYFQLVKNIWERVLNPGNAYLKHGIYVDNCPSALSFNFPRILLYDLKMKCNQLIIWENNSLSTVQQSIVLLLDILSILVMTPSMIQHFVISSLSLT